MDSTMIIDALDRLPAEAVEYVTITPQNPTAAAITNVRMARQKNSFSTTMWAASIGLANDVGTFYLWTSTLGGYSPKQLDLMTDAAGVVYKIQSEEQAALNQIWQVVAQRTQ